MVTVPYIMVGLEKMLEYRGVGLERFYCIGIIITIITYRDLSFESNDQYLTDTCHFTQSVNQVQK